MRHRSLAFATLGLVLFIGACTKCTPDMALHHPEGLFPGYSDLACELWDYDSGVIVFSYKLPEGTLPEAALDALEAQSDSQHVARRLQTASILLRAARSSSRVSPDRMREPRFWQPVGVGVHGEGVTRASHDGRGQIRPGDTSSRNRYARRTHEAAEQADAADQVRDG